MSGRSKTSMVKGLAAAAVLMTAPAASSVASAQETIMLERIGAVRMVQSDEARELSAARQPLRLRSLGPQRNEDNEAAAR